MRFVLHKVLASHVTDNFKPGQRYVVNYKLPDQPIQVINERVSKVTHSDVLFETQTIPKNSILNVCFLLSLPSELLRLSLSFLDPATQCAIAPTSSLINDSLNNRLTSPNFLISPEQRRLNARNFINTFALPIESNILKCFENREGSPLRRMETLLQHTPLEVRSFVREALLSSRYRIVRESISLLIQRENNPILRYAQDIEMALLRGSLRPISESVQKMETEIHALSLDYRAPVREAFRSSSTPSIRRIEALLTQRETNPIVRYTQDIEFSLSKCVKYCDSPAVQQMEMDLNSISIEYRDRVRDALRSHATPSVRYIETLLTQRENDPIIRYAQNIEADIFKCTGDADGMAFLRKENGLLPFPDGFFDDAVTLLHTLLENIPVESRDLVRHALRSSKYPSIIHIEALLAEKERPQAPQDTRFSIQTDFSHLGG